MRLTILGDLAYIALYFAGFFIAHAHGVCFQYYWQFAPLKNAWLMAGWRVIPDQAQTPSIKSLLYFK